MLALVISAIKALIRTEGQTEYEYIKKSAEKPNNPNDICIMPSRSYPLLPAQRAYICHLDMPAHYLQGIQAEMND